MPKVSVIVPVYKTKIEFLKEMLASLSAQTLADMEFILVFDGKDESLEDFCRQETAQDSRFSIVVKEHNGVSGTRNFGMAQAKGDYISFVDADDWITPNIYEDAYNWSAKNNSDITFWDMALANHNSTLERPYEDHDIGNLSQDQKDTIMRQFIWITDSKYGAIISVCCKLIKRSFLQVQGNQFDKSLAIGEDRVFFQSLLSNATTVSYLNQCGYFYRQDSNSAMHKYHADGLPFLMRYLNAFDREFFEKYRATFGREAYRLLTLSWDSTYMNKQNPNSYWNRMKAMSNAVKQESFQNYLKQVDEKGFSLTRKIEVRLLRRKITFTLWLRGLAKLLK